MVGTEGGGGSIGVYKGVVVEGRRGGEGGRGEGGREREGGERGGGGEGM